MENLFPDWPGLGLCLISVGTNPVLRIGFVFAPCLLAKMQVNCAPKKRICAE